MQSSSSALPFPDAYLHFIIISPLIKNQAIKNQQVLSAMIYDKGEMLH
jgi:hypothetical protein